MNSYDEKKCCFYLDYYQWKSLFRDRNYIIKSNICYRNVYKPKQEIDSRNYIIFLVTPSNAKKYNGTMIHSKRMALLHKIKKCFKENNISVQQPVVIKAKFIGLGWVEVKKVKNLTKI